MFCSGRIFFVFLFSGEWGSGGGEGDCVGSRRFRRVGRGWYIEELVSFVWGRGRVVLGLFKGY